MRKKKEPFYGIVICPNCGHTLRVEDIAVDELEAVCKLCGKSFTEEDVR